MLAGYETMLGSLAKLDRYYVCVCAFPIRLGDVEGRNTLRQHRLGIM